MKGKVFVGAKAICECGHTGEGENSEHSVWADAHGNSLGMGRCSVPGCNCQKFVAIRSTKKYRNFLSGGIR
jgi:hypothetical protein